MLSPTTDGDHIGPPDVDDDDDGSNNNNPHDVWLGRGGLYNRLRAGSLYRKLILQHYEAYVELESSKKRQYAIDNVILPIRDIGGRFWVPAATAGNGRRGGSSTNKSCGNPSDPASWKEGSDAVIVQKVMQALRDCKKDQWDGNGASPGAGGASAAVPTDDDDGGGTGGTTTTAEDVTVAASPSPSSKAAVVSSPRLKLTLSPARTAPLLPLPLSPKAAGNTRVVPTAARRAPTSLRRRKVSPQAAAAAAVPPRVELLTAFRLAPPVPRRYKSRDDAKGAENANGSRGGAGTSSSDPALPHDLMPPSGMEPAATRTDDGAEAAATASATASDASVEEDHRTSPSTVGGTSISTAAGGTSVAPPLPISSKTINLNERGHLMNTVRRETDVCALYHSLLVRYHPEMADVTEEDEGPFVWNNLMAPLQQAGAVFLVFPDCGQVIASVNHKTLQCISRALRDADYVHSDDVQLAVATAAAEAGDDETATTDAGHNNLGLAIAIERGGEAREKQQGLAAAAIQSGGGSQSVQPVDTPSAGAGSRTIQKLKRSIRSQVAKERPPPPRRRQDGASAGSESDSIRMEDKDEEFASARDVVLQMLRNGPGRHPTGERKRPAADLDDGGGSDDDGSIDDQKRTHAATAHYRTTKNGKRSRTANHGQEEDHEKTAMMSSGKATPETPGASTGGSHGNVVTRSATGALPVRRVRAELPTSRSLSFSNPKAPPGKPAKGAPAARKPRAVAEDDVTDDDKTTKPGFLFKKYPWELRYRELIEFVKETGHCNVPQRYEKNPALGRFVKINRQYRVRKRRGGSSPLTDEREALLEAIGFQWEVKGHDSSSIPLTWEMQYRALKDFKKKYGHCDVPKGVKEYYKLWSWVQHMRSLRKVKLTGDKSLSLVCERNILSRARENKLDELGFSWLSPGKTEDAKKKKTPKKEAPVSALAKRGYPSKSWLYCFRELIKFYDTNHLHPDTPNFVRDMRLQMSLKAKKIANRLTDEREDVLNALGFEWKAHSIAPWRIPTEQLFSTKQNREFFLDLTGDLAKFAKEVTSLEEESMYLRGIMAHVEKQKDQDTSQQSKSKQAELQESDGYESEDSLVI